MNPNNEPDAPQQGVPLVVLVPRHAEAPQAVLNGARGDPNFRNHANPDPNGRGIPRAVEEDSSDDDDDDDDDDDADYVVPDRGGTGGPGGNAGPKPDQVDPNLSLAGIGGLGPHISFLERSILYPILHPEALQEWGVDPPKGILFHGPPGTGKTLLAKTLAATASSMGDRKVSFFYHKGGDSFSMWFGETEQNLKKLFDSAKRHKPSIIFFDELDGLAPNRSSIVSGHAYTAAVTTLLGLIDSVKRGEVFIIAATNRVSAVDPAVLRPGRFDKFLEFTVPDEACREEIIRIKTSHWKRCKPTDELLKSLARETVGYTGADLAKLSQDVVSCAYIRCNREAKRPVSVTTEDWETAISQMTHSSTSVFGSALIVSRPIPEHLVPLAGKRIQEILNMMGPLLPHGELEDDERDLDVSSQDGIDRQAFLLYDTEPNSREFLHFVISRGVLAAKEIAGISVYDLSVHTLFSMIEKRATGCLISCVEQIVNEAINSVDPAILFVPQLDILDKLFFSQKKIHSFYSQLERVKGSKACLFATTYLDRGLQHLKPEMRVIFGHDDGQNNKLKLRYSWKAERKEFLSQPFMHFDKNSELGKEILKKVDKAADETKGDREEDILRLYHAFIKLGQKHGDDMKTVNEDMKQILGDYATTKLK